MTPLFFINLPIKNLKDTMTFFTGLGFTYDERFTDDKAAAMIINEHTSVMLLQEPFFRSFTPKDIADSGTHAEVILSLAADSREEVDAFLDKAMALGARPSMPTIEMQSMYSRSFQDLDGHLWEIGYMDFSLMGPA